MAKSSSDRTTIDLFEGDRRPGRPKTNPLPREEQLKVDKRNQIRRDKEKGLKRIECKVSHDIFAALQQIAKTENISRSELIESILAERLLNKLQT